MQVQFVRWGNSLALRIPTAYARDLNVVEGTTAELKIEEGRLVATPAPRVPEYSLEDLLAQISDDNVHAEVSTGRAVGDEFR
jgi:antitoxin MazE